jgi:hypothetical protein
MLKRRTRIKLARWFCTFLVAVCLGTLNGFGNAKRHPDVSAAKPGGQAQGDGFTGSVICRESHEKFCQLWAPSHHGLTMQPYTPEFASNRVTPQTEDIITGEYRYRAEIDGDSDWALERVASGKTP